MDFRTESYAYSLYYTVKIPDLTLLQIRRDVHFLCIIIIILLLLFFLYEIMSCE